MPRDQRKSGGAEAEFTQPRDHYFAHPVSMLRSIRSAKDGVISCFWMQFAYFTAHKRKRRRTKACERARVGPSVSVRPLWTFGALNPKLTKREFGVLIRLTPSSQHPTGRGRLTTDAVYYSANHPCKIKLRTGLSHKILSAMVQISL